MHERVGAFASGQLHELIRFVLAPVLVNLAAQPIQQGNVGALIHVMERGAQCASCRSKELGRVQVAQGIGRKIAKATHALVDILEAALSIVRDFKAEHGLEAFVPFTGHILDLEVPRDEGLFHFITQNDV